MSADLFFLVIPGILYLVFAFREPPKVLDAVFRVPGLFSLFPEQNRVKHGRITVGVLLIVVALGGLAHAVYEALTLG